MEKFEKKLIFAFIAAVLAVCSGSSAAEYELLKSTDHVIRMKEIQRLGNESATEAVPEIIKALSDESAGVRISAAVALGKLGDEAAVVPLKEAIENDPSRAVKIMAIQSLSRFNRESVQDFLINIADNDDDDISAAALRSLGRLGGPKAQKKLISKAKKSKDNKVKKEIISHLIEMYDAGEADEDIQREMKDIIDEVKKNKDPELKKAAERAEKRFEKKDKKKK